MSSSPASARSASESTSAPLRVLHLFSGNLYGGIETFLRTLAAERAQCPSMVPEFAGCFEGQLATELRNAGVQVHILPTPRTSRPWTIVRARRALEELLAKRDFDVVVCHAAWVHAMFAPAVRSARRPLVFYLHDFANPRQWLDAWAGTTRPDLVIANSEATAKTAASVFAGASLEMLRYPVRAHAVRRARSAVREQLGSSSSSVVILQASRMQPWKGQQLLVEALPHLPKDVAWECWFAGGAQRDSELAHERALKTRVAELGLEARVRFLGQRADVADLMAAADIFCQPNASPEPFGIVFVEALAAGLPVVTTTIAGGAREIIDDTCGRAAEPSGASIAEPLAQLLIDARLRRDLSEAGPLRARKLTEPRRSLDALAGALRRVKAPTDSASGRASLPSDAASVAALSGGGSADAIYSAVERVVKRDGVIYDDVVDVGCGKGSLGRLLRGSLCRYVGCDLVAYSGFPKEPWARFVPADLNQRLPLDDASADLVLSVEVIEHLENPRAFVRELVRICRPGGRIVITTPNQLSLMSKLSLVTKNQFVAFQEAPGLYPTHITALVEMDLRHIAAECGLLDVEVAYTDDGRIPLTATQWPAQLGFRGRWFSDNVVLSGTRPG